MILDRNSTGVGKFSSVPVMAVFDCRIVFPQGLVQIAFLILLLVTVYLIIRLRFRGIRMKDMQKEQLELAELRIKKAELTAFQNQMNPHFMFNALNAIQNYIFKNDSHNANHYLSKFSKLMRMSLEMSKAELISLDRELFFLKEYVDLEKMRFPDKFRFTTMLRLSYPLENYLIPPLLVQPLIENAIKHGFKEIENEGQMHIEIDEDISTGILRLSIGDNGSGISVKTAHGQEKQHHSMGLNIIRERLDLMNERNGHSKGSLTMKENAGRGTLAILTLERICHEEA